MNKKIIKVMSVLQILLSLVAYISMSIHFDRDTVIFAMLANTDLLATVLRLSLYAIPGIHLLSGLYGLVFEDKRILLVMIIVELISSALTFTFVSASKYMLILSIISTSIAGIYLICTLTMKNEK